MPTFEAPPRKARLLDQVRYAVRLRHYSPRTEAAYVGWIRRFILSNEKRHPRELGAPEVTAFLSSLATGGVSASTQNQALSAILFLYDAVLDQRLPWMADIVRARRPVRLPVVLSRDEVMSVLGRLRGPVWLMASLLYGSGLRLLECVELRVKDVDLERCELTIRDPKGGRDRVTMLPAALTVPLRAHLAGVKAQHDQDLADGRGAVVLPGALRRKYRPRSPSGPGNGCSLRPAGPSTVRAASGGGITFTRRSCSGPSRRPFGRRVSRGRRPAIRSGTPSRRICSKPGMTSGRSRNYSAIGMWRRRWCIRTC